MALVVSRRFLTAEGRARSRAAHVSFAVEKWQAWSSPSIYFGCPCQYTPLEFHFRLHINVALFRRRQEGEAWIFFFFLKRSFAYRSTTGDSSSFTVLLNFSFQVHAMHEAFSCRPLTASKISLLILIFCSAGRITFFVIFVVQKNSLFVNLNLLLTWQTYIFCNICCAKN